jgi:tetratricopeptide (TPR) repeat protein
VSAAGLALGLALSLALAGADEPGDPAAAFREAGERYLAGDFEEAVRRYQALLDAGHSGPALHYDLGNAWFRAGRPGRAAASWERALRLDPGDAEAAANLELVRRGFAGRMPWARAEPLRERVAAQLSDRAAAAGLAVAWALLWLALGLRLRARGRRRGWLAALSGLAVLGALGFGWVIAEQARGLREPRAVVVAPGAGLRETPSDGERAALELPEGAALRIVGVEGEFARVRLPGGVEGWARREELEPI